MLRGNFLWGKFCVLSSGREINQCMREDSNARGGWKEESHAVEGEKSIYMMKKMIHHSQQILGRKKKLRREETLWGGKNLPREGKKS